MLYPFKYSIGDKTHYFLWDIESGSLHVADLAAYLIVKGMSGKLDEAESAQFSCIDQPSVKEISEELNKLTSEGSANADIPDYSGVMKRSELKALCINICHDCNLSCKYCFANEGNYNTPKDYMSEEVARRAIDLLIEKSGTRHSLEVDFFGGEPLMNMDVVKKTVAYAEEQAKLHNKEFSFTTTTNGVLLNDDNIKYLNEKMNNVVISIDGRPEVHNAVRCAKNGRDAYGLITGNALRFRKARGSGQYYIRGTFTARNAAEFDKDVMHIRKLGFDQISIEPVVLPPEHPLNIRKEQTADICKAYERLAGEYIASRRDTNSWFNFFHFMIDLEHGPCITKRLTGCGAGAEYLAVAPDGNIYPCHQFVGNEDFKMGNVLNGSFDNTVQDKFRGINVSRKERCKDCPAKYFCSGGCIANSYNYEKDLKKPYEAGCDMMRKRFELALAIYAVEKYGL